MLSALSEAKKNPGLKQVILLSPSAASFDQYKNFEHRGNIFKKLVKKYAWLILAEPIQINLRCGGEILISFFLYQ